MIWSKKKITLSINSITIISEGFKDVDLLRLHFNHVCTMLVIHHFGGFFSMEISTCWSCSCFPKKIKKSNFLLLRWPPFKVYTDAASVTPANVRHRRKHADVCVAGLHKSSMEALRCWQWDFMIVSAFL